jgi:hypothetical protein
MTDPTPTEPESSQPSMPEIRLGRCLESLRQLADALRELDEPWAGDDEDEDEEA